MRPDSSKLEVLEGLGLIRLLISLKSPTPPPPIPALGALLLQDTISYNASISACEKAGRPQDPSMSDTDCFGFRGVGCKNKVSECVGKGSVPV